MIEPSQEQPGPRHPQNTYPRLAKPARRTRIRWRRHSVAVMIAGLGIFVVALAGIVVAIQHVYVPGGSTELWKEVSKGLVQLALVAVLGGAVGLTYRLIDEDRERRHALHAQRLAIFDQLLAAYHELRSARREMKFAGLHLLPPVEAITELGSAPRVPGGVLSDEHVSVLKSGMLRVANVQLSLNKVSRSLGIQNLFDDYDAVSEPLGELSDSVEHLVREWQTHGVDFWPVARQTDISSLPLLQKFLADKSVSFGESIAEPFGRIYRAVGRELYGAMYEESRSVEKTSQSLTE